MRQDLDVEANEGPFKDFSLVVSAGIKVGRGHKRNDISGGPDARGN
jgi:hypothetical protein